MSLHLAVQRADMAMSLKAVCWSLLALSDWDTGANITASLETIGRGAGLKPRATTCALRRLTTLGVVRYDFRSKGGRGKSGHGIVHRLRLVGPALESMNPARDAGVNPALRDDQPRTGRRATLHLTTKNPAPDAHNQTLPKEEPNPPPPQGGGGGCFACEEGEESGPPRGEDEVLAATKALTGFGVSKGKAQRLARCHSLREVEAGIAWVRQNAGEVDSPAAILVTAIEDGTAAEQLERDTEAQKREREAILAHNRCMLIQELRRWTLNSAQSAKRTDVAQGWRLIDEAWPGDRAIAEAQVLPDEELLLNCRGRAWELFDMLLESARAALECRP